MQPLAVLCCVRTRVARSFPDGSATTSGYGGATSAPAWSSAAGPPVARSAAAAVLLAPARHTAPHCSADAGRLRPAVGGGALISAVMSVECRPRCPGLSSSSIPATTTRRSCISRSPWWCPPPFPSTPRLTPPAPATHRDVHERTHARTHANAHALTEVRNSQSRAGLLLVLAAFQCMSSRCATLRSRAAERA
jgi:hypothetical protein